MNLVDDTDEDELSTLQTMCVETDEFVHSGSPATAFRVYGDGEVVTVKNRSAPPCGVIPVVAYPDVATAVAWLEAAFGFRVRLKIGNHRAQVWFESACLVVGETGKDNEWATRSSTMLRVQDVDALFARALAQGARILHAPQTHVYGERQATLEDFAGHIWTLTQTVQDVDPAVWGGEVVEL